MAIGLVVLGLSAYGFLTLSARAVGAQRFATLFALWALALVAGTGFFFPLEQELARSLAARRIAGHGGGPVIRRAAGGASAVLVALVASVVVASPWLLDELFDRDALLLTGLLASLGGFAAQHLVRGVLLGCEHFKQYALVLAAEGLVRVGGCGVLLAAGVSEPGPYGVLIGVAPALSSLVGLASVRSALLEGPEAARSEVFGALGALLGGSLLAQLLVNVGPVMVKALATDTERAAASRFVAGLVLARVPLFLFSAILASALPRLSSLVAEGRKSRFRASLTQLLTVVGGLALVGVVLASLLGPEALRILYGPEYELGRSHLLVLSVAGGAQMLAFMLAAALIALSGHVRAALGWLAGVLAFFAVSMAGHGAVARVESGLLAGAVAALACFGVLLVTRLRGWREGLGHREEGLLTPPAVEP